MNTISTTLRIAEKYYFHENSNCGNFIYKISSKPVVEGVFQLHFVQI